MTEAPPRQERVSWSHVAAVGMPLALGAVGLLLAARAFLGTPREPSAGEVANGKIAFITFAESDKYISGTQADIYVMNSDGSARAPLVEHPDFDIDPAWSPDGSRIAFVSGRDDAAQDLYVMDADGRLARLVRDPTGASDPAWSPDGRRIAFESGRGGSRDIWVIAADGSGLTRLTDDPLMDQQPTWSPDGTRIAFVSRRDGDSDSDDPHLYVMNEDGTEQERLTSPDGAAEFRPAWSPDGTRIAFEATVDVESDIYVVRADGSALTRLTTDPGEDRSPAWSPDGTKIAFETGRDGNTEIYVMNADGSGETRITHSMVGEGAPAWQPVVSSTGLISRPPSSVPGTFVPTTYREKDTVVLPLTFPDGSTTEILYPPELDLASLGVTSASIAGSLVDGGSGSCGFEFNVWWSGLPRVYEGEDPLATYPGAGLQPVELWQGTDGIPYQLVYRFGPWLATLPCDESHQEDRVAQERWSRSLSGQVTPEGFLVLEARYPLKLFPPRGGIVSLVLGLHGSPDKVVRLSPKRAGYCRVDNDSQAPGSQKRMAELFPGGGTLCVEDTDSSMLLHVYGEEDFVEAILRRVIVRRTSLST